MPVPSRPLHNRPHLNVLNRKRSSQADVVVGETCDALRAGIAITINLLGHPTSDAKINAVVFYFSANSADFHFSELMLGKYIKFFKFN